MLPDDLPQDFLEFNARFGTDEQCREYLFRARWPDGFRCDGCGHDHAYTLRTRLVYECVACRKQHSLLAGTIFEQTKTALARWFLAIYLVTSSKGGIAAAELQRQLGLGSYQTAWSWLHKLRKAMVRPDREPLAGRVEADETYVGGPRPGKRGRGAAGKTLVAGAVEAGETEGRRLGRLRLAGGADASAASLEGFLGAAVATPTAVATDGWSGYAGLAAEGSAHQPGDSGAPDAAIPPPPRRRSGCPASTSSSASSSAGCWAPTTARSARSTCRPTSTSTCSGSTAAPPSASATASPGSSSKPSAPGPSPTGPSSPQPPPPEARGEADFRIPLRGGLQPGRDRRPGAGTGRRSRAGRSAAPAACSPAARRCSARPASAACPTPTRVVGRACAGRARPRTPGTARGGARRRTLCRRTRSRSWPRPRRRSGTGARTGACR